MHGLQVSLCDDNGCKNHGYFLNGVEKFLKNKYTKLELNTFYAVSVNTNFKQFQDAVNAMKIYDWSKTVHRTVLRFHDSFGDFKLDVDSEDVKFLQFEKSAGGLWQSKVLEPNFFHKRKLNDDDDMMTQTMI